jgi:hypothetical protein
VKVFAYCAANYTEATRRAAGVEPLVCPPVTAETLDLRQLEGNDFIFINLHSLPGAYALLGTQTGPPIALRAEQLQGVDLGGSVVFSEACFMGDEQHPMRKAFLDAGASAVVAGPGENAGATNDGVSKYGLKGADVLGLWLRRGLFLGLSPLLAFKLARQRVRLAALRSQSAYDAMGFKFYERT